MLGGACTIPLITADEAVPVLPGHDLWDCWPLAEETGNLPWVPIGGRPSRLWFFLSAPRAPDPECRHDAARIRLMSCSAAGWRDHGLVLPCRFSPGSREWAGSAVLAADGERVTLYFTAAGRRGEAQVSYEQRLFAVTGRLDGEGLGHWAEPEEIAAADGWFYRPARQREAVAPGTLQAFRDPFWFRDPGTGQEHLVFTGSAGWTDDPYNGVIGLATRRDGAWQLDPPLVEAVGINNELERPQLLWREGLYYLFWSTHAHTFAPAAPPGPRGLYGMVADQLGGPWRPLNGSGLVAATPRAAPIQSYSWCVTAGGEVWSFVDYPGLAGLDRADDGALARRCFGGTPAPVLRLAFAGDRVQLV